MADIFISYAREDTEAARRLAGQLETHGWSVFWDRRIPAGQRFAEFISEQLGTARCVITLWSRAANASDWVQEEADEAKKRDILVPAFIEAVEPPLGFRRIQAADLVDWHGEERHEGFRQLVRDIGRYVPAQAPLRREPPETETVDVSAAELEGPRAEQQQPAVAEAAEKDRQEREQQEAAVRAQELLPIPEFPQIGEKPQHRRSTLIKLAVAVLAVVACVIAARQAIDSRSARLASEDSFEKGVLALKGSQYVQATELLTKSVSLNPTIQARLYLAEAYKLQLGLTGDFPKHEHPAQAALQQYQAVLKQEPNNVVAICSIGLISFEQQRFIEAEHWYKRAVDVSPLNKAGFYSLGVIAWGRAYPDIMSARSRAGMAAGDSPPIKDKLIRAEMREKHLAALEAGIASMRKALELDEDYADAMEYTSLLYRELADLAQGVNQAQKDSEEADGWLNKYLTARSAKGTAGSEKEEEFLIAPPPPPPPPLAPRS